MSDEARKMDIIIQMFKLYPSTNRASAEEATTTLRMYLLRLQSFPPDVVARACNQLTKQPSPFPPSAPDVYAKCDGILADQHRREQASKPRLPRKLHELDGKSAAEKEKAIARINEMVRSFKRSVAESDLLKST